MASTSTLATTDFGEWLWVLVRGGADCAWVLLVSCGGFWKNFLFFVAAVALFALGNMDFAFALVSSALVRCLGVACGVRRIFGTRALLDEFHIFSTLR